VPSHSGGEHDRRPLIGRARELAELDQLAREAVEGRGGIVLVSGEAGVGKTALVDAALAAATPLVARAAASPVATRRSGRSRPCFGRCAGRPRMPDRPRRSRG